MDLSAGDADLHMHTLASDGTSSLNQRVAQAAERGLDAIAVTDHDRISESLTGRVSHRSGVEVVTGVEIRADVSNTKVELLGYYVQPSADILQSVLEQARAYRSERNREMVASLTAATSVDFDYDQLREDAYGMLGRPHLAAALVDAGLVDSVGEAFATYLGTGGEAYVPMERVSATDVLDGIHQAGGVVSLAHPGRIRSDDVASIISTLVDQGLDAIEVKYPYDSSPDEGYADIDVEAAASLADEYDLLHTGGSDCHGPGSGKFRIGEVRVSKGRLDTLRTVADRRQSF